MLGRKDEIAYFQSDFYRIKYHKLLRSLVVSLGIVILLLLTTIYFILFQPAPDYYGSTLTGTLVSMIPRPS